MSDPDGDDLGVNMIAGCGCASALSLFVMAPLGFWLGLWLGGIAWAIVLAVIAGALGPVVLTIFFWGWIAQRRLSELDCAGEDDGEPE